MTTQPYSRNKHLYGQISHNKCFFMKTLDFSMFYAHVFKINALIIFGTIWGLSPVIQEALYVLAWLFCA